MCYVLKGRDGADPYRVGVSVQVGDLCCFGVAPKVFEVVVLPCFSCEDVDDDVAVVDDNPFRCAVAVVVVGFDTDFVEEEIADIVGNGGNLHGGVTFADYERVGRCGFDIRHVEQGYFFSFTVLYGFDYFFGDYFRVRFRTFEFSSDEVSVDFGG